MRSAVSDSSLYQREDAMLCAILVSLCFLLSLQAEGLDDEANMNVFRGADAVLPPSQGDTHVFFTPKIALNEVRWAYWDGTEFRLLLSQPQEMLVIAYRNTLLETRDAQVDPSSNGEVSVDEELLLQNLPEYRGQSFAIVVPETLATVSARIKGFVLVLNVPSPRFEARLAVDANVPHVLKPRVGATLLAFATDKRPVAAAMSGTDSPNGDLQRDIHEFVCTQANDRHLTLEVIVKIVLRYPNDGGWAIIERSGARRYLFCVTRCAGNFAMIPFQGPSGVTSGCGFLLEDTSENTCFGMRNSELMVLPDMDGNGGSELFVRSTVSVLFDIHRDSSVQPSGYLCDEAASLYLGP